MQETIFVDSQVIQYYLKSDAIVFYFRILRLSMCCIGRQQKALYAFENLALRGNSYQIVVCVFALAVSEYFHRTVLYPSRLELLTFCLLYYSQRSLGNECFQQRENLYRPKCNHFVLCATRRHYPFARVDF